MSRPTCSRPPSTRPLTALDLEGLAEHLVGGHGPATEAPVGPALVRARAVEDGVDLALAPLPAGLHPADALLGHIVPRRWSAAGVVAPATAHDLTTAPEPAPSTGAHRPITVALLVGRDGTTASVARTVAEHNPLPLGAAPTGRLVDLLLRALRRPTAPPRLSTRSLWEALWLDAVVADAARADGSATLAPALAHALTTTSTPEGQAGWEHLRRLAAAPETAAGPIDAALAAALDPLIDPSHATWMDDGCFARWTLGTLPAREDLLSAVDALLPPAAARAVHEALDDPGPHGAGDV